MSHYIFIADFFADRVLGGAELVNEELIRLLQEKGHTVQKMLCEEVTQSYILENKSHRFILSNFMHLGHLAKEALQTCEYVLYEHDHKYVINRNPGAFPNFIAPKQFIVNKELYQNAKTVFCQTKIHEEVLRKNLNIDNTKSLGSSLWSSDFLENVLNINNKKTKKAAILKDSNKIKNQESAQEYCQKNGLEFELVNAPSPLELVKKLSQFEYLVFFPGVLETFSRVSVEAKMVGCKIITNKLLGVASESWFATDSPEQMVERMKKARQETVQRFEDCFNKKKESYEITAICNSYRRPYNLPRQLDAIKSQSIKPKETWVWVNHHKDNQDFNHTGLGFDRIFHNNYNWKFYGRFAAALLADTEYIAIFDDDTIPGERWFENCIETMKKTEGIMGSAGIILKSPQHYMIHDRCGWPTRNEETTQVDLVGHAWFFKREWLQYLWREKPFTWNNGEDIQFSYLAQKYGGIKTYCPPHPLGKSEFHGSILGNELGVDEKATSNNNEVTHHEFFKERDYCVQNAIAGGWKTVLKL
jgi:hypothetical protein